MKSPKSPYPPNDQVTPAETAVLLDLAAACLELSGDWVEFGCYKGDTSVLLGRLLQQHHLASQATPQAPAPQAPVLQTRASQPPASQTRATQPSASQPPAPRLWLYDSFAGLPEKSPQDLSGAGQPFQAGALAVTKHEVTTKLRRAGLKHVIVKKAWFSDLTPADLPDHIAFAFLDGDLYDSIKTSLRLVAPRLVPGARLVVHDYNNPELPGATRAVDEFLRSHPRTLTVRHSLAIMV